MPFEFIRYEKRAHTAIVTIARPEVMNSLHPAANEEMDAAWNDFAADPDLWVGILTGEGEKAFSAGNDLKWTAQHGMPRMPRTGFGGLTARFDLWKPIIAAVNGFALGGGLEMAIACDVIVAAEHATLGLPEPRVGLLAAAGGVHRLPRHVPLKVAMGMMLTGKPITAAEAHRIGLVNEVVPSTELMATAERWASTIAECSPRSVQATKQAAMEGLGRPLPEAMAASYDGVSRLWASADAVEGPRAFAEKRKPRWTGR
ncbi:MAG TPA: enoyl-CoA hydratase-related protein [Candidatus Binatia bacterium]|jgi:enoyl-CoA hydratase/carnithine racemase|nr:enoyl-CoA hydratase-related protein [Candidatus Binatia bacterium]